MHNPSSMDIIFLIHRATLELYGIKLDPEKTIKLAGLLGEVAEGGRTFIDSSADKEHLALTKEAEEDGVDLEEIVHDMRMKERNAARRLSGLPMVDD